jgi:asparagine N-glycosylation enzyme membrane subunit Stt3
MKRISQFAFTLAAAVATLGGIGHGRAQDAIDKAKAVAFDNRVFAAPLGQKTYACFVRRYDANHLAQHPGKKSAR